MRIHIDQVHVEQELVTLELIVTFFVVDETELTVKRSIFTIEIENIYDNTQLAQLRSFTFALNC
jgi:hypothetical protein